jgi:ribosomal protein L11 methyltransferase
MSQAARPFLQIELRARDAAGAERLLAEAYAAGAAGCVERESEGPGKCLLLYVEAGCAEAVVRALRAAAVDSEIGAVEPVPERDWALDWREGLGAVVVSPRLVVRPSFVAHAAAPGQATVLIEPGQAFGTGGHESTRLALELLDAWLPRVGPAPRVLDVGTGSGVLVIAAAKLGARRALGIDLDPVATAAAAEAVRANAVADRVTIVTGPVAGVARDGFELVVANLLRRELEPILGELAERLAPEGTAILTGLIEPDRGARAGPRAAHGLAVVEERARSDARGERWIGLVLRAAARAAV